MARQVEAQVRLSLHDGITAGLNRISQRFARIATASGLTRLNKSIGDVGRGVNQLGAGLATSATRIAGVGATVGAAAAGITAATFGLANSTSEAAREIGIFSQLANASPEMFQRWAYGARTVGIEQDKLSDILKDVNDRVGDFVQTGGGPMADFFEKIGPKVGVTAQHFKDLSGPEALQLYVSSLQKAGVSQQDMVFYMEAMASDATALIPLLADGGAEMSRLGDEAARTGNILDESAITMGRDYLEAVTALRGRLSGLRNTLGIALLPVMERFADRLTQWIDLNKDLVTSTVTAWVARLGRFLEDLVNPTSDVRVAMADFGDTLRAVADTLAPMVDLVGAGKLALVGLGALILGPLVPGVVALTGAFVKLGAALLMTPVGWIAAGLLLVGASIYVLTKKWDEFVAYWGNSWGRITSAFDKGWMQGVVAVFGEFNPLVHVTRGLDAVVSYFTGFSFLDEGGKLLDTLFDGIKSTWGEIKIWGEERGNALKEWFDGIDLGEAGRAIITSLWDGMKSMWGEVSAWVSSKATEMGRALDPRNWSFFGGADEPGADPTSTAPPAPSLPAPSLGGPSYVDRILKRTPAMAPPIGSPAAAGASSSAAGGTAEVGTVKADRIQIDSPIMASAAQPNVTNANTYNVTVNAKTDATASDIAAQIDRQFRLAERRGADSSRSALND